MRAGGREERRSPSTSAPSEAAAVHEEVGLKRSLAVRRRVRARASRPRSRASGRRAGSRHRGRRCRRGLCLGWSRSRPGRRRSARRASGMRRCRAGSAARRQRLADLAALPVEVEDEASRRPKATRPSPIASRWDLQLGEAQPAGRERAQAHATAAYAVAPACGARFGRGFERGLERVVLRAAMSCDAGPSDPARDRLRRAAALPCPGPSASLVAPWTWRLSPAPGAASAARSRACSRARLRGARHRRRRRGGRGDGRADRRVALGDGAGRARPAVAIGPSRRRGRARAAEGLGQQRRAAHPEQAWEHRTTRSGDGRGEPARRASGGRARPSRRCGRAAGTSINMASMSVLRARPGLAVYGATKHAVLGVHRVAAGRPRRGRHPDPGARASARTASTPAWCASARPSRTRRSSSRAPRAC